MATIKISNLSSSGLSLFDDSESFLSDISSEEAVQLQGGWTWLVLSAGVIAFNAYKGYRDGRGR